ncbi:YdeI/OmpD-associated family protein [Chitinophaga deserti]|uniref:YdeI/OmpD-associated family protein n=1 Tax=Chitinophaga deserti TaxID=2164099 RepID=UPI000D6B3E6F|nr:DUF1801 domain-containing protein [Chitinophaga deserti]
MNSQIDKYISRNPQWEKELVKLRKIILDCHLNEELKWGVPCYTYEDSNIVLMHTFKDYCALLFHKGVLLKDPEGILIQQTENVQSARQVRFTKVADITKLEKVLKAYIFEAIELEESGAKVPFKKTAEFKMPDEFKNRLEADAELKDAFEALTPGRQRGYLLHFSAAKQSKTRESRIDKYIPWIMEGKGLNDE